MEQEKRVRYQFLYWLRCIGVCLIVYDHLGPLRNPGWIIAGWIEKFINTPLGLIQYFGAFAVCLFFIISGFCLTASASTGRQFAYNKIIRILVTLFAATVLFYCFNKVVSVLFGQTYWDQFSFQDWRDGSFLICYLFGRDSVINGATWYLFPLMSVFLAASLCYRLFKKNPIYLVVIVDAAFVGLWLLGRFYGYRGAQMQWLIFMLVPMFGVLIRSVIDKRIGAPLFVAAFTANYLIFLENIVMFRHDYYSAQPYLISLGYAILIFGILLLLEDKIKLPKTVKFMSDISFSLYLLHMPFGGLIMSVLERYLNFTVSFFVAVTVVILLAWGHYVWIEKYCCGLLKKLTMPKLWQCKHVK